MSWFSHASCLHQAQSDAPWEARTPDLEVNSLTLWPAELRKLLLQKDARTLQGASLLEDRRTRAGKRKRRQRRAHPAQRQHHLHTAALGLEGSRLCRADA